MRLVLFMRESSDDFTMAWSDPKYDNRIGKRPFIMGLHMRQNELCSSTYDYNIIKHDYEVVFRNLSISKPELVDIANKGYTKLIAKEISRKMIIFGVLFEQNEIILDIQNLIKLTTYKVWI